MNKTVVLVVEDDRPIRNLIVTTLKMHDYKYLTANNGVSAIMEASSHHPDIVLLDLGLPDMEGVDVIKKIRTWSNMPIIVISARSEDSDKIEALDSGADDYITKPFSVEEHGNTVSAFSGHVTGSNGQWGDYYKRYNPYGRGAKNYYTDTADNVTTYGDGGDPGACRSCIWAKNGVNGYGVISKTWKKFGMGGTSAIPQTYFVPSLEGKLVVTIPDAAGPEEKGGTTVAKNVKNNVVGRIFYGYGAAGGKADESLEAPSAGEHSQFSLKGGGAPAPECTPRSYIPGGYAPVTVAVKKCTKVVCNIVEANEDKIKEENVMSTGVEVLPQGFVKVGSKYALKQSVDDNKPEDITPFVVSTSTPSSQSLSDYFQSIKLYEYIKGRYTTIMNNLIRWIKISGCFPEYNEGDEDKTEFAGYDNKDTVYNTYRCFRDSNIKYEKICAEDVVETKETQGWHAGMIQPAICKENASPGTSYGAGGGGGNASDTPGVFSKGGNGGYGAVIVEW